jgi:hypothetical protein
MPADEPRSLAREDVARYYPGQREPLPRYYPEDVLAEIPEHVRGRLSAREMERRYSQERRAIYDGAKLVVHITPRGDCSAVDPDAFSCESVNLIGNNATDQTIYLFIAGVDSLNGVDFGISYSPTVTLLSWETCDLPGVLSISLDDWPASGSRLALAFNAMRNVAGAFVLLGCFQIEAGSTGDFQVQGLQGSYEGHAAFVMCDGRVWYFDNACRGRVRVGGLSATPPYNPCSRWP